MTWVKGLGIAAAILAAALLAGCAGHPAEPVPPAQPTNAVQCAPDDQMLPRPGSVPAGFVPVAVYRCNSQATVENAEGRWGAVEVEQLTGDLHPLLSALAEPDDARSDGPCPAMAELVRELWLVDAAGNAIRVHYPRTGCGFTKPAVHEALDRLSVVGTTTQTVR